MSDKATIVRTVKLSKHYGVVRAVDDLSLTVQPGEVVGFVGANGAGKTTTINLLLGILRPSHGEVFLFDKPITPATAHQSHRQIGYAAGDMALFEHMTGRAYLHFTMRQTPGDHVDRLVQLQKIFSPELDKKIKTLSRGNRQKIALIAAFVTQPKLVILDEPTSGLDPVMQEAFLRLVEAERQRGTTIFMSSHYLQEVAEVCTRVVLMKHGKVVRDMPASDLTRRGAHTVRVMLTAKPAPLKGAEHVRTRTLEGGIEAQFSYAGDLQQLLGWLHTLKGVKDIEITTENLEEAFLDLYQDEEARHA